MQTQPQRDLRFFPVPEDRPRKRLTMDQVRAFNQRGYLSGLPVFAPDEVERNRATFDRLLAQAAALGMHNYQLTVYERVCRSLYDLVVDPRILDHVEDILGPDFLCWSTHCFCKLPGDPKAVTWHQDATYWDLTPSKTVTAWLAIDDADERNSAVRVIPGSHLVGPLPMRRSRDDEDNALWLTTDGAEAHGRPETMRLRAGEMSLHTDLLLHDSLPNRSSRRRCGFAIRYCAADVRIVGSPGRPSAFGRGSDPSGYWSPLPRPEGDDITVVEVPVPRRIARPLSDYP